MQHVPVLLEEVLNALQVKPHQTVLDGTVGYGGHAEAILKSVKGELTYIGLDRDQEALESTRKRLKGYDGVALVQASYGRVREVLSNMHVASVDAVLLDLGASSPQFDRPERGFSFKHDGPLDMRFDVASGEQTAADILNTYREQDLIEVIRDYGEERRAVSIAKAIVSARREQLFSTTKQLTELIERITPRRLWPKNIHPATRTFQALRIETNKELDTLSAALPDMLTVLKPGGRLAVISFHSLEDRIVKQFFKDQSLTCVCPPKAPVCTCNTVPRLKILTKKVIQATEKEQKQNPRSRSAKMRVAQKI